MYLIHHFANYLDAYFGVRRRKKVLNYKFQILCHHGKLGNWMSVTGYKKPLKVFDKFVDIAFKMKLLRAVVPTPLKFLLSQWQHCRGKDGGAVVFLTPNFGLSENCWKIFFNFKSLHSEM